jgi:hypothetical protein
MPTGERLRQTALLDWQRDRLYGEIRRRLAGRPDRSVRRHLGAVLHVARRLERPTPPSRNGSWAAAPGA